MLGTCLYTVASGKPRSFYPTPSFSIVTQMTGGFETRLFRISSKVHTGIILNPSSPHRAASYYDTIQSPTSSWLKRQKLQKLQREDPLEQTRGLNCSKSELSKRLNPTLG